MIQRLWGPLFEHLSCGLSLLLIEIPNNNIYAPCNVSILRMYNPKCKMQNYLKNNKTNNTTIIYYYYNQII